MNDDIRNKAWLLREKYSGEESPAFLADCARLEAGEPLAYVIGWQPFLDTKIHLDSKPLIPRPETEYWVGKAIATMPDEPLRVLDLCAGSGAIGVAVAKARPLARVDFCEIDARHHVTITDNVCNNGIDFTTVRIFGGDLFEQIPRGTKYDFILSNPPYIDPALDRAEKSVKNHEPHLALYGGVSGMEIISRIITQAPDFLAPGGQLCIEHEPEQEEAILRLATEHGFASCVAEKDQYGVTRLSILTARTA